MPTSSSSFKSGPSRNFATEAAGLQSSVQTAKPLWPLGLCIQSRSLCTARCVAWVVRRLCSLRFACVRAGVEKEDLQRGGGMQPGLFFGSACFYSMTITSGRRDSDKSRRLPVTYLAFPRLPSRCVCTLFVHVTCYLFYPYRAPFL